MLRPSCGRVRLKGYRAAGTGFITPVALGERVSLPGPAPVLWAVELLAFAGLMGLAGEGVRRPLARLVEFFRADEPFERFLLDLYLGGALLYLVAALPLQLFSPAPLFAVLALALASTGWSVARAQRDRRLGPALRRLVTPLGRPLYLLSLAAALGLAAVELIAAGPVATGNTFDSSVDTLFVTLLTLHGSIPLTLAPVASGVVAYPQGSTAWFAFGQWLFALPPPRTALLVTPLFMALAPLGAFTLGRRWFGSDAGAAALALVLALLGPGTRYFAAGSNDFVLAFPLVLFLGARTRDWVGGTGLRLFDAIAFGALAGYSAALNPVGAQWLFLLLPLLAFLCLRRPPVDARRWWLRWLAAAAAGVVWVLPALAGLAQSGPAPPAPARFAVGELVSLTDPFVVRSTVITFSPFLPLTIELAGLLVVGAGLLVWMERRGTATTFEFGRWTLAGVLSGILWIAAGILAGAGVPFLGGILALTSLPEMSDLLFTVYAFIAAVPVALLLRDAVTESPVLSPLPPPSPLNGPRRRPPLGVRDRRILAAGLALVLLVPGSVLTVTDVPPYLGSLYHDFSNVTSADFDLLAWAGAHLPSGARVLVAPGSAAEFLPGYLPTVALLYPMTGPLWRTDPAYLELRGLLANGTLGSEGHLDLERLGVQFVAVTGNSTALYPAFSPAPFLNDPAFQLLFHENDAYLFEGVAGP